MSYQPPPRPAHGDFPTGDMMQVYSDDLNDLYDRTGGQLFNWPTASVGSAADQYLRHQYRWLVYDDNGTIEDPTAVGATVTLDDPGGIAFYDLNTVEWLTPGMIYRLTLFDFVMEVEQRVIA